MSKYTQLTEIERIKIYRRLCQKISISLIAEELGRHVSTVYREISRNHDEFGYLFGRYAHQKSKERKARHGSKIERSPALKAYVLSRLAKNTSPVVIAGCWNRDGCKPSITAETIYRFIYRPENKGLKLWKLLPNTKEKRGMRYKQRAYASNIPNRVSIHERPLEVAQRQEFGHFEVDLLFTKGSMSANVLVIIERTTRLVLLYKHTSKHSSPIIASIRKVVRMMGGKSVTFDNGSEFAEHWKLKVATYFCDKSSPWQKGSVENMNSLLRRHIPFSMNSELISQEYLDWVANNINSRERKVLNFKTPLQVFTEIVTNFPKQPLSSLQAHYYQKTFPLALHC